MYGDSPPPPPKRAVAEGAQDKGMTTVCGCKLQVDKALGVVRVNGPGGRCLFRLAGIPRDELKDHTASSCITASLGDYFSFVVY